MTKLSSHLSIIFVLHALIYGCLYGADFEKSEAASEINQLNLNLENISDRFQSLRSRLESLSVRLEDSQLNEKSTIQENQVEWTPEATETTEFTYSNDSVQEVDGVEDLGSDDTIREGFYFIPFLGLLIANELEWDSVGPNRKIETSNGISGGLRLGYSTINFFADVQVSYFEHDLKKIDLPLSFSGEVNGLGVYISGGGRVHLSEKIAVLCGVGLGGLEQEVSFNLSGIPVNEKDFLFSAQFMTGLEFRPLDQLIFGLCYRWLPIQGMNDFSSRSLHQIELSTGYHF